MLYVEKLRPFSLYASDNLVHIPYSPSITGRDFSRAVYKPRELRRLFVDATKGLQ